MQQVDLNSFLPNPKNQRIEEPTGLESVATVRRSSSSNELEVISGHLRLQLAFKLQGWASVMMVGTGQIVQLHQVDGGLLELVPTNLPKMTPEDWYIQVSGVTVGYVYLASGGIWAVGVMAKDGEIGPCAELPSKAAALEFASQHLPKLN